MNLPVEHDAAARRLGVMDAVIVGHALSAEKDARAVVGLGAEDVDTRLGDLQKMACMM